MACVTILQGSPTWLTFIATDEGTGAPRSGITYNQIDVSFKRYSDTSFNLKVLAPTDFREIGLGVYEILFSATELNVLGSFVYVVQGNGSLPLPLIRQYIAQAMVQSSSSYTPGTISLPTNILTGNLIDLHGNALVGESVSARVLSSPNIIGAAPNIGGIGTDIVSTQTDNAGFFALEVLQNSVVDIVIPVVNYRRTLTVPANSTDILFEIP
jgi:hypothetical protein